MFSVHDFSRSSLQNLDLDFHGFGASLGPCRTSNRRTAVKGLDGYSHGLGRYSVRAFFRSLNSTLNPSLSPMRASREYSFYAPRFKTSYSPHCAIFDAGGTSDARFALKSHHDRNSALKRDAAAMLKPILVSKFEIRTSANGNALVSGQCHASRIRAQGRAWAKSNWSLPKALDSVQNYCGAEKYQAILGLKFPINSSNLGACKLDGDRKLTASEEETVIDMILDCTPLAKIAKHLDFKTRREFTKYMADNAEFFDRCERARVQTCTYLEDELLSCADDYDAKEARVKMDSISRILKFRDPKRYGDKLDMSVTHTIDIAGSLARAEQRIIDVTPLNNLVKLK